MWKREKSLREPILFCPLAGVWKPGDFSTVRGNGSGFPHWILHISTMERGKSTLRSMSACTDIASRQVLQRFSGTHAVEGAAGHPDLPRD